MRIAMFTNTYLPHVGGVAHSVSAFEKAFRRRGHQVCVVAPEFPDAGESTSDVLRVAAVQRFNGSDFSFTLPQPGVVSEFLRHANPEILHSHHPFLLGDTALRFGWTHNLPVVFTHHTLYEQYTHYVPLDSEAIKRVVVQLVTEYINLCTHVIAPSQSIAEMLVQRGVARPITVIPTGIDLDQFGSGDGAAFRRRYQLEPSALVIGHVGRLAEEKNLGYLAEAVGLFLSRRPDAIFVVVGSGDEAGQLENTVTRFVDPNQLRMVGVQRGPALMDAYAAMDLFAFSSQSETQGMVLVEAMAANTPVVALDGPGVRDVVNEHNGLILPEDAAPAEFAAALEAFAKDSGQLRELSQLARDSIASYSITACSDRMLSLYDSIRTATGRQQPFDLDPWDQLQRRLTIEWNLLMEKAAALTAVVAADISSGAPGK